jgi:hypothetical protein
VKKVAVNEDFPHVQFRGRRVLVLRDVRDERGKILPIHQPDDALSSLRLGWIQAAGTDPPTPAFRTDVKEDHQIPLSGSERLRR